jgi:hypothetical protein
MLPAWERREFAKVSVRLCPHIIRVTLIPRIALRHAVTEEVVIRFDCLIQWHPKSFLLELAPSE